MSHTPSRRGWFWTQPSKLFFTVIALGLTTAGLAFMYELQRRKTHHPLSTAEWQAAKQTTGQLCEFRMLLQRISQDGCAAHLRADVWPFLLQLFRPTWDAAEQAKHCHHLSHRYTDLLKKVEELDFAHQEALEDHYAPGQSNTQRAPLDPSTPAAEFAEAQRGILLDAARIRQPRNHKNGEVAEVRYPREAVREAFERAEHLVPPQRYLALRLVNLLCAYAVHDPVTGYCQGMSDLALPFVLVFEDDVLAFWCFEHLMRTTRRNFQRNEAGIKDQLQMLKNMLRQQDAQLYQRLRQLDSHECFFAYRMLLVMLRRELKLPQAMTLWEIVWAEDLLRSHYGPRPETPKHDKPRAKPVVRNPMLILVIAAAVRRQRQRIMRECRSADDILALFSTSRVDLWPTLQMARKGIIV